MLSVCKVSTLFAYSALIYIIASVYYLMISRSFGTPYMNAVKKIPELMKIKKDSFSKRSKTFYMGLFIGIILIIILRPFKKCVC